MGAGKSRTSYLEIGDNLKGAGSVDYLNKELQAVVDEFQIFLSEAVDEIETTKESFQGLREVDEFEERIGKSVVELFFHSNIYYEANDMFKFGLARALKLSPHNIKAIDTNNIRYMETAELILTKTSAKVITSIQDAARKAGLGKLINDFTFLRFDSAVAAVTKPTGSTITVAVNLKHINRVSTSGFNAHPINALGDAAHEMGHALDIKLSKTDKGKLVNDFKLKHAKSEPVSIYGASNKEEAFAEASSLYFSGVKSTKLGKAYYKDFKKLMKDVELDSTFGVARQALDKNLYK